MIGSLMCLICPAQTSQKTFQASINNTPHFDVLQFPYKLIKKEIEKGTLCIMFILQLVPQLLKNRFVVFCISW